MLVDELARPLSEVTFVVVDLETTGTSPRLDAITEVGALKVRGGEVLGTFDTLVHPGVPIPPFITVLTGITEAMVVPAPRIESVLPAFVEFASDAVLVGHNVRFDVSFLDAALGRAGYPRLANRRVDTLALGRRLLRDEIPDMKLHTLAHHLHATTEPAHRAYADAAATADVFHALLERAAGYAVFDLDDLVALPRLRPHDSSGKLRLTAPLPRHPGVYVVRDRRGTPIFVGPARNLRACVRSHFGLDEGRTVPQLVRELASIDHRVCAHALEADVRALRLRRWLKPRLNRRSHTTDRASYVKVGGGRTPRLVVGRTPGTDPACVGPFHSAAAAHAVREAIELAVPPDRPDFGSVVRDALGHEPERLLDPLATRARTLADAGRAADAIAVRERLAALARALERQRLYRAMRGEGARRVETRFGPLQLAHGRLVLDEPDGLDEPDTTDPALPPGRVEADEILAVARWVARYGRAGA